MKVSHSLAFLATLTLAISCEAYFFSNEELEQAESSPTQAFVFPEAIGPANRPPSSVDDLDTAGSETVTVKTNEAPEPVKEESTSVAPSTTSAAITEVEIESTTPAATTPEVTTTESESTTVKSEFPAEIPPQPVYHAKREPGVTHVWHQNSQGVNTNSVWFSNRRDPVEANESQKQPVYVQPSAPEAQKAFPRKPVFASSGPEPAESNTYYRAAAYGTKTPTSEYAVVGEYTGSTGVRESGRNLYYPDISRINTGSSASASAAASASASSSAYSSGASTATFGTKGGSAQYRTTWQQQPIQSPVKAIRKVVKTAQEVSNQRTLDVQSQPVRVRVVVQPKTSPPPPPPPSKTVQQSQNRFYERLQQSNVKSSFESKSSFASAKAYTDQKEYVAVNQDYGVKGAVKSPPPPPRPAAPVKSYPTKSAVRAPIRQPVFEQQQQHLEDQVSGALNRWGVKKLTPFYSLNQSHTVSTLT